MVKEVVPSERTPVIRHRWRLHVRSSDRWFVHHFKESIALMDRGQRGREGGADMNRLYPAALEYPSEVSVFILCPGHSEVTTLQPLRKLP
jgi:hypothetical protein